MVQAIRAAQLADQIRDYLAVWTSQDFPGFFFSLTQVTLSPDLSQATVWVDILQEEQQGKLIRLLNKEEAAYNRRLRKVIRRHTVPQIRFVLDEQERASARIDELLNEK